MSLEDITLQVVVGIADETDRESIDQVASRIFNSSIDRHWKQKDTLLQELDRTGLSKEQRLLLGVYGHLYGALQGHDLLEHQRLKHLRMAMGLNDDFAKYIYLALHKCQQHELLAGRKPIMVMLEPSDYAVAWVDRMVDRACQEGIYYQRLTVRGISLSDYEHPADRRARERLQATPGLELLMKKLNQHGIERILKMQYTGSYLKVTEKNYPLLIKALHEACDSFDLDPVPDLYLHLGFINSSTTGIERPVIALTSGAVGLLSYDELLFVLGHEIGHIKSQHIIYQQLARVAPVLGELLGTATLGIGSLLSTGLVYTLNNWQRVAEYTADRAGLLVCQDLKATIRTLMKIAGAPPSYYHTLDPADFLAQADQFEGYDDDNIDKIAKSLSVISMDHPWTVARALELHKWAKK